jgi:hypothetical protein
MASMSKGLLYLAPPGKDLIGILAIVLNPSCCPFIAIDINFPACVAVPIP